MRIPYIWDTPQDKVAFTAFVIVPCLLMLLAVGGCTTNRDARSMRRDGKSEAYTECNDLIMKRAEALIATGDPLDILQATALMQASNDIIKLRIQLISDIIDDK